jgi:hypothetical protein
MTIKKMTEREVFQLVEASDLLGEYGYEDEADLIARISENEQILLYTPNASAEQRQTARIHRQRDVEDESLKLAEKNQGNGEYCRALFELVTALNNRQ